MSFRRTSNAHDCWLAVVRENSNLLREIPTSVLATERAFREYVTEGAIRGSVVSPSIPELSDQAIESLGAFIHHKAQFDMDATLFHGFNAEYRRRHLQSNFTVSSTN